MTFKIQSRSYVASLIVTTVVLVGGVYFLNKRKKHRIPTEWKEVGKLTKLYLYPLKSGRRIKLDIAECTPVGIIQCENPDKSFRLRDRCLIVFSSHNNEYKTARTYPKLLHIVVTTSDPDHITINAPSMRTLHIKVPTRNKSNKLKVKQFRKEEVDGIDCGNEAAQWLSQYLLEKDEGMRFAYNDATLRRRAENVYKDFMEYYKHFASDSMGLFSDIAACSLINQASIDELNGRLDKTSTICHNNFRPNFLIEGPGIKPYDEDKWDWIKIGDIVLRNVVEGTRCVMVVLDQDNAVRDPNMEPLKTMKKYRMSGGPDKSPIMGIFLKVYTLGNVKVGDTVYIGS